MKILRRRFLQLAAGSAALAARSRLAFADDYPSRPVRILVGVAAGGSPDILGRLIGNWLTKRLGQPFVIENRVGAAGNVAADAVAHAEPDGATLLLVSNNNVINAALSDKKTGFNLIRDIAPIGSISRGINVMVVNPAFPARTLLEFIAYAKANPGKISMASAGVGSGPHLTGELFQMVSGIKMIHVPYRGGSSALTDVLGDQVQVYFANPATALAYLKEGKLRALAVTGATRSAVLPDIPAAAEFFPGFETSSWLGLGAPKNTPVDIIARLNEELKAGLADPGILDQLAVSGNDVLAGSPADFGRFMAAETEKWERWSGRRI